MARIYTRYFSLLYVFMLFSVFLLANTEEDSSLVKLLPSIIEKEISSMYKPLKNGKHPSEYQFAIANPTAHQIEAWMDGNYDSLQGVFSENGGNKKGNFFSNTLEQIGKAQEVIDEILDKGNFCDQFDGNSLVQLPVGKRADLGDGTYVIVGINAITLYPTHSELNVYAKVETPKMLDPIYFGSPDIHFSYSGGVEVGSLGLLGNIRSRIMEAVALLEFQGAVVLNDEFVETEGTYVKFDCDGLKEFNLDVDLVFNKDVIRPVPAPPEEGEEENTEDQSPNTPTNDEVRAELEINVNDTETGMNDILVSIDFDQPFIVPQFEDVIFTADEIIFDFSESRHDADLTFPVSGYTPNLITQELWQGVYIKQLSVELPKQIVQEENFTLGPEQINIQDVVIDQTGFTGQVFMAPVFSLGNKNMSGWYFSIDEMDLRFFQSDLASFEFEGDISIPLLNSNNSDTPDESSAMPYMAAFDLENDIYQFSTTPFTEDKVYESGMLNATITLHPTSNIHVTYEDGEGFEVVATLSGDIEIDSPVGNGGGTFSVSGGTFENLQIANKGGFIRDAGNWGIEDIVVDLHNFDLTVAHIGMQEGDAPDEAFLFFFASLNIGGDSGSTSSENSMAITAEGGFRIAGKIETLEDGGQKWRYDRFLVDALFIDVENDDFKFSGHVIFFEEMEEFGSGFQGKLRLIFKKLDSETGIEAMGIFGNTGEYRYFLVDVLARFNVESFTIGGLNVRGIGGGVYVNMRPGNIISNFGSVEIGDQLPDYSSSAYDEYKAALEARLGQSLSGILYTPDNSVKLGVNAGIVLATPSNEEIFNANVRLFMEFNNSGGLNQIGIRGFANVMAPISWTGPSCTGLSLYLEMMYQNGTATETGEGRFTARALTFVNFRFIKGGAPLPTNLPFSTDECDELYYAGGVDILISREDWYINIGIPNPNDEDMPFPGGPIAIDLGISGLTVGISTYFDVGTNIPPFPGLPEDVESLSGFSNLIQDENTRATGKGFAFGARVEVDTDINLGIVRAGLNLDIGFDVMMQKYADVICVNNYNLPLGMNGWYASGQAWVYIQGYVDVLGFRVLDAALAAVLQMKGPDPFYVRGVIAGRYRVMGGLIKGDFRVPIKDGKECLLEDGSTAELVLPIIDAVLPLDRASNLPVDVKPSIEFAYPVNKIVSIDTDGDGEDNHYMIQLDEYEVRDHAGELVDGQWIWSHDGYAINFLPSDVLIADTNYVVMATATLYETSENGTIIGGPMDTDVRTNNFNTGEGLDYIPLTNVQSAWPADGQFNYYQEEDIENYIQLVSGQDEFFTGLSNSYVTEIHLSDGSSPTPITVPFLYDANTNRITYDLPPLEANKSYRAELRVSARQSSGSGSGSSGGQSDDEVGGAQSSVLDIPEPLLTFYFRVSAYPTFENKLESITTDPLALMISGEYKANITNLQEPFGIEELLGIDWFPNPSLSLLADLDNTAWMNQFFNINVPDEPNFNLYEISIPGCGDCSIADLDYSIPNLDINRKNFNVIPDNAVSIVQDNISTYEVTEENYLVWNQDLSLFEQWAEEASPSFNYAIPKVVRHDYLTLQSYTWTAEDNDGVFTSAVLIADNLGCGSDLDLQGVRGCCYGYGDFITQYHNNILNPIYNNDAILRQFNAPPSIHCTCVDTPFEPRPLNTNLTSGSAYPLFLNYQFPDNSESEHTINLQYSSL